ncbi:MAG TPA: twitching motility protein PilT [Candidatus Nitrosotenuis sp.]|nr:twitching motility protein PilT [Candidatus Nitrosotenuis sp.]
MVDVICDTSFLIHIANNRIKNLSSLETEIGNIRFVVPDVVISELTKLGTTQEKKHEIDTTLQFIKPFKRIELGGTHADDSITACVEKSGGTVATMDKELKSKIKKIGGSIISVSNNKIVLE